MVPVLLHLAYNASLLILKLIGAIKVRVSDSQTVFRGTQGSPGIPQINSPDDLFQRELENRRHLFYITTPKSDFIAYTSYMLYSGSEAKDSKRFKYFLLWTAFIYVVIISLCLSAIITSELVGGFSSKLV
jgi:hypothetical protein